MYFETRQLTRGDQRSRIIHRYEGRQGFRKFFLIVFSMDFHLHTELVIIKFVTSFRALIMLSHSPCGAPLAKKTTCSFAVSPHCKVGCLFGFLQPHHQPLILLFWRLSPTTSAPSSADTCAFQCRSTTNSCMLVIAFVSFSSRCAFTCFHIQIPVHLGTLRQQLPHFSPNRILVFRSNASFFHTTHRCHSPNSKTLPIWNRHTEVFHFTEDCSCWSSDFRPRSCFPHLPFPRFSHTILPTFQSRVLASRNT